MKERPILFSGPMVRAILDGRKTQTRRVVRPEIGAGNHVGFSQDLGWHIWWDCAHDGPSGPHFTESAPLRCPYGQPGDLLYVRETWQLHHTERLGEYGGGPEVLDDVWGGAVPTDEQPHSTAVLYRATDDDDEDWPWRPSIHMPKWAARIWLEITDVRVERLSEISDEDARAEGYEDAWGFLAGDWASGYDPSLWVWVVSFAINKRGGMGND